MRFPPVTGWALLLAWAVSAGAEPPAWPLESPPELSSSFGEYRTGRFHMGIDLRTGGVTGKPVHAAADGHVSRVRCSPWGYGRALYLQFNDGTSAVYGHLEGFADDIRDYVRAEQHRRREYTVDLSPPADRFPVRRGQLIARSGDTGAGPPHLHWELRDASASPVNPRLLGLAWNDATAPVPKRILVTPAGPRDRVNGDVMPVVLELKRRPDGVYECPPVSVAGRAGVGVDFSDPNGAGGQLGAYSMRLFDGETLIFEVRHDRLSYADQEGAKVAYHPALADKGKFLLLWRWPGNKTPSYAVTPGDGLWEAPGTGAELRVELADFMGNTARVVIPVTPPGPPVEPPAPAAPGGAGKLELDWAGGFLVLSARFPDTETETPELLVDGAPVPEDRGFFRVGRRTFRAAWAGDDSRGHSLGARHPRLPETAHGVEVVLPGKGRALACGGARLEVPGDAPLGPLHLRLEEPAGGASPALALWPENAPLARPAILSLPVPPGLKNPARAGLRRGDAWVGGTLRDGRITAKIGGAGLYRVAEDDSPPRITELVPGELSPVGSRRPVIRASVADSDSGVASWSLTCGGQWLLSAYDPEAGRVTWERDADLPPGEQELVLTVTDGVGNRAGLKRTVMVP